MTRRQAREAYKEISLSQREKEALLNRILSASDRTAPGGKDRNMRKRTLKPILIAAIVALMVLLMGSAWAVLNLDDLIIGQHTYQEGGFVDEAGETIPPTEYTKEVISLQGIEGTPNYQAAAEWYAYEQDYTLNHWEKIQNNFQVPEAYQAYSPGNQEMIDKIDEICEKYVLMLAGERIYVETWHDSIMLKILDIENLVTDAVRDVEHLGGYFYACGNFKHEFEFYLDSPEASWQYPILASLFYHDKKYLDTVFWSVNTENYNQWSYTCSDSTQVLIVTSDDRAEILCDRDDAFISLGVFRVGYDENDNKVYMTERDLELIAEAIDFSMKPQKPDIEAAKKQLEEATTAYEATKPVREPYTYADAVQWQINGRFSEEPLYFALGDFNEDGVEDLLFGYSDRPISLWTIMEWGEPSLANTTEEEWVEIEALYPSLDIAPVEEFPFEEY